MEERKSSQKETLPSAFDLSKKRIVNKPKKLTVQQQKWKKNFDKEQTPTAGVEDQVHEVLHRIVDEFEGPSIPGPRMTLFQKVWKEMSFGLIFHGRESFRELYEFTEDMFDIVKQHAVKTRNKTDNPEEIRFAAMYLLYALYFKQPCRPMVKIRLTLEEFDEMVEFMDDTRDCHHYDVMFSWAKLFSEAAFLYVASPGPIGLELAYQLEQKEIKAKEREQRKTCNDDFFSSSQFQRMMQRVTRSHDQYQNIKKQLVEENPDGKNVFCGTEGDFPATLIKIAEGKESSAENNNKKDDIGENRKKIKNKFFSDMNMESHRDRLFIEGRKKANSQSEDDENLQMPLLQDEIRDQLEDDMEQDDINDMKIVIDRVPWQGKPRSKLRGKNKRRGVERKPGRPRRILPSLPENAELGLDELAINTGDVEGNLVETQARRELGGRKHHTIPYITAGPLGRGVGGRGAGRGVGNTHEGLPGDQNCNFENMEDDENNDIMINEGNPAGAGPSGVISRGKGRGRGGKINRRGVTTDKVDGCGNVEEQDGASGQVGEKMEKAKVKRKNKKGMWGNAASRNSNQEEQVEQEPVFKFNKNT